MIHLYQEKKINCYWNKLFLILWRNHGAGDTVFWLQLERSVWQNATSKCHGRTSSAFSNNKFILRVHWLDLMRGVQVEPVTLNGSHSRKRVKLLGHRRSREQYAFAKGAVLLWELRWFKYMSSFFFPQNTQWFVSLTYTIRLEWKRRM